MKFLCCLLFTGLSVLLSIPAHGSVSELSHLLNNVKPYSQEDISRRLVRIPPQNIPFYSSECSAIQVNQTSYLTNRHCAEQLTYTLQKQAPAQLQELQQSTYFSAQNEPEGSADDAHDLVYLTTCSRHNNKKKQAPLSPLALYHSAPDDDTIFHGRTVTYWSNPSEENDTGFAQMKAELDYCDEDYCYLQHSSHNNGDPYFLDNQLLCIGLKDSSLCRRVQPAHHVSKRDDGCTTSQSGCCIIKQCNAGVGDCSLCRDGNNCTIQNGDCDGRRSLVRKVICSSGAQCAGYYRHPATCTGVRCDEGACGKDCSESCTFRGSIDGGFCPGSDDLDCHDTISPWVIIGPIAGGAVVVAIAAAIIAYFGQNQYFKYKYKNRPTPPPP